MKIKLFKRNGEKILRVPLSSIVYAILILFVGISMIGAILAYGTDTQAGGRISAGISRVIPFPAAIVNWKRIVYLDDLQNNLNSVAQFYQTQDFAKEGMRVDFSTEIGQKRLEIKKREILDKMVEDEIVLILAKDRNITISEKDVDKAVTQKLKEFGTENDVKIDLLKSYGWTMDDFKKRVVLPSMYTDELSKAFLSEVQNSSKAKDKIQKAQDELKKGTDFSEVAKKFSEGSTAAKGGELGWVRRAQVIPELADVLFLETKTDKNVIVETPIGFHIAQVENRKKEDGEDVLQIRQIFVAKNTFADWLDEQKKKMKIWIPMKEFVWNQNSGSVDFRNEKMQQFEKDERSKTKGDASIMF